MNKLVEITVSATETFGPPIGKVELILGPGEGLFIKNEDGEIICWRENRSSKGRKLTKE